VLKAKFYVALEFGLLIEFNSIDLPLTHDWVKKGVHYERN